MSKRPIRTIRAAVELFAITVMLVAIAVGLRTVLGLSREETYVILGVELVVLVRLRVTEAILRRAGHLAGRRGLP